MPQHDACAAAVWSATRRVAVNIHAQVQKTNAKSFVVRSDEGAAAQNLIWSSMTIKSPGARRY
jgi:hypothetical protein